MSYAEVRNRLGSYIDSGGRCTTAAYLGLLSVPAAMAGRGGGDVEDVILQLCNKHTAVSNNSEEICGKVHALRLLGLLQAFALS